MNTTNAGSKPQSDSTHAAVATATAISADPGSVPRAPIRHLVLVLGDQLDVDATALDGFDPTQDCIWMA